MQDFYCDVSFSLTTVPGANPHRTSGASCSASGSCPTPAAARLRTVPAVSDRAIEVVPRPTSALTSGREIRLSRVGQLLSGAVETVIASRSTTS